MYLLTIFTKRLGKLQKRKGEVLKEKKIAEFTEKLAGRNSVPGGGAASAVTGAFGSALASMVSELTIGKKKYAEYEEDVTKIAKRAKELSERFLFLANEDAEKYRVVSEVYAIRAVSEEEKKEKSDKLEEALKGAIMPPMEMLESLYEAAGLFRELSQKGSKLLVSDTGGGAALCEGAARVSLLAVYANTKLMKERDAAAKIDEKAEKLLSAISESVEKTYSEAVNFLKTEGAG